MDGEWCTCSEWIWEGVDALTQGQEELDPGQNQPLAEQGSIQGTGVRALPAAQQRIHRLGVEFRIRIKVRLRESEPGGLAELEWQ